MRRSLAALAIAAAFAAQDAGALTFLQLTTGDEAFAPDARSVALGRTRVAEPTGVFTAATNPALLTRVAPGIRVMAGGNTFKLKETRSIPAFDSFDSFIVESVYVLNDEYQYDGGVGLSVRGFRGMPEWLGFAASFAPIVDFQYDYSEEVRDNNPFTQPRDALIALNEVQSDGTVDAWTIGAGGAPHEMVNVGASIQFLRGDQSMLHRTQFAQTNTTSASIQDLSSLSGMRGVFGISVKPGTRFEAAVTWLTETSLDGDFTREGDPAVFGYLGAPARPDSTEGAFTMRYPHQVAAGVAFYPRAKLRTAIRADVGWTEWSQFEHGLFEDLALNDVWDARVGVEHVFYNEASARLGFHFEPSPQNDEVATSTFTFGGGFEVGALHADLAFEVGSREYRFVDLFDDGMFGGTSRVATDLVEESALSAFLTVSYAVDALFE